MNIQVLKWVFIILGAVYFFSWIDILPDRIHPLLGRLDDFLFIGFLAWRYYKLKKRADYPGSHSTTGEERASSSNTAAGPKAFDPYHELGISRGASEEQIDEAYKRLMVQYHPDKVHHLGPELKKLAHEKTLAIQKAYDALRRT